MHDGVLYHIYAKSECLYPCLEEDEFKVKWSQLNAMVGLMHTDYDIEDLSYEKLPPNTGGYPIQNNYIEPAGGDLSLIHI